MSPAPYMVDYSTKIDAATLETWPLTIAHPEAELDLKVAHAAGNRVLAYVSIVEIAGDAVYKADAKRAGLKPAGYNEIWRSDIMDVGSAQWRQFVVESLVTPAMEAGFDGVFLDTVDSAELLIKKDGSNRLAIKEATLQLVREIRAAFPNGQIVLNRGLPLLADLKGEIDGVMVESLFQTYDLAKKKYASVSKEDSEYLLGQLKQATELGLEVFVLDYVDPRKKQLAFDTAQRIESYGYRALIAEPDLMGRSLAPIRHHARKIRVLYGRQTKDDFLQYPHDTQVFQVWQPSIEWLGYEFIYDHVPDFGIPSGPDKKEDAAVIVSNDLALNPTQQQALWEYLERCVERNVKVLFQGDFPEIPPKMRNRVLERFGLKGSFNSISLKQPPALEIAYPDSYGFEMPAVARQDYFLDIIAPENADVWLRARSRDPDSEFAQMDAVFVSDWGGAILSPYESTVDDLQQLLLAFDPLAFGRALLETDATPVPDITTAYGTRAFYSHIDGDAAYANSEVEPGRFSAEVIQERIIEKYPLPITVSFITAETRGEAVDVAEFDQQTLEQLAREIFAIPHVQVASHTFSHPFFWSERDRTASLYTSQNLEISGDYSTGPINLHHEIIDSVAYIDESLAPEGKTCDILLWSGNCRPPPEALRIANDADILTMNGGDTVITQIAPIRSLLSPKAISWAGQTQIFAANQNENLYNNYFGDGLYNGYSNVISTFEMTETPIRFKPVNVYYHFYSANRLDAFKALETVYQWLEGQALFPLTAKQYIQSVQDSLRAKVYSTVDGYILHSGARLKTWRIPASRGYPDLARSTGLLGFNDHQGERYLSTDGRERIHLVMTDKAPKHPYLKRATIPFKYTADGKRPMVEVEGWTTGLLEWASAENLKIHEVTQGEVLSEKRTQEGLWTIEVTPGTAFTLSQTFGSLR